MYKIEHLSGTVLINGINVTVTPTSTYSSVNNDACGSASPYYIGTQIGSGISGYQFDFNPPTDLVTLNFSGLDNVGGNIEEIQVFVNGAHYPITSAGTTNECGGLASITPQGNIRACTGCTFRGWNGTNIPGPVNTITISDQTISGNTGGSVFSLFVCDPSLDVNAVIPASPFKIASNPVKGYIDVRLLNIGSTYSFFLMNSLGQAILSKKNCNSADAIIDVRNLRSGIYYLKLVEGNNTSTEKVIIDN